MARTKHTAKKSTGAKGGKGKVKAKKQVAHKSVGNPVAAQRVAARAAQSRAKGKKKQVVPRHPDSRQVKENKPVKKHRFKPGTVALRQIRQYQKSTELLLAKAPFRRFVIFILDKISPEQSFRMERAALAAFQEIMEAALVDFMEAVNLCAIHAQRVTVMAKDVRFLRRICSYHLSVFSEKHGMPAS